MKFMNAAKKFGSKAKMAVFAAPLFFAAQAHAALDESIKDAISSAKADGLEAGWLVLGVIAALFVIRIVKGLLR